MTSVSVRMRTEADDPAIVDIRNEARPWLPPTSVDEYRWQADPANSPPDQINERWVAEMDGTVVGLYVFGESTFVARENTFGGNIGVAKQHRNTGIGSELSDHMMSRAEVHKATRIYSQVSEDSQSALTFAENRGFEKTGRATRLSRLVLAEANLDGYEGLVDRLESDGIDFRTMAEIGTENEAVLRQIFDVLFEAARDIPSSEEFTEIPFEVWLKWLSAPTVLPNQSWVAFEGGQVAGVAMLSKRGEESAFNDYTGMARKYRGKGIARALKQKTIESTRELGLLYTFTANDAENKPMLSINIPLGYEAIPAELEIRKDL